MALRLCADPHVVSTAKIAAAAKLAGVVLDLAPGNVKTPCGISVPELTLQCGSKVRYTTAILRRVAQVAESDLYGSSFLQEGQVDSWLEWVALDVDHHDLLNQDELVGVCKTLEVHLKSKTFLVGQRLTVADISASLSLKSGLEKAGMDSLRESYPSTIRWAKTCYFRIGDTQLPKPAMNGATTPKVVVTCAKASEKKAAAPKAQAQNDAPKKKADTPQPKAENSQEKAATDAQADAAGGGKKEEKKKAKEDAKMAKEEAKKKREEEQRAAALAKLGPQLTQKNFEDHNFGNLFIQSEKRTDRKWTSISDLKLDKVDQEVWLRSRVHASRIPGSQLGMLTLRQGVATVQAVVEGKEVTTFVKTLKDECVVDIFAKVVPLKEKTNTTQSDVELSVQKIFCIGRSEDLPMKLADAGRSEKELEADPAAIRVGQDVRLDNRIIDLRTLANQAIFRIQSGVCTLFREYLLKLSFQEIHTPKLIGGASEGGADIFRVDYFEGSAYLAQSPQLYKQMALMSDMPRVFEIGPIFRSERSFTHRHMTEFTGLDLEMTFNEHYHEVLDVLDGLFNHIFLGLKERFSREIDTVRDQYPFEDLKWKYPCKRLTFKDAIELLKAKGPAVLEKRLKAADSDYEKGLIQKHMESIKAHDVLEDISTEDEKVLGVVMLEEYEEEFYIIDKFPKDVRPFYTMPDPEDSRWGNAYDLFLRGEEITSGAQRIHDPNMLAEKCKEFGVDPQSIQTYIDAFKYGSYPHAGGGIGMERVVMLFLNLNNIRKTSMFPRDPKRLAP